MQHILNSIMGQCHVSFSDNAEISNAVTRDLLTSLEQLVAATANELHANPDSPRPSAFDSWFLLDKLADALNRHFRNRSRTEFLVGDADTLSAAVAARGVQRSFTRFMELLSTDEERERNAISFKILLMDSVDDTETSMRFAFLDIISRRIVAL